MRQKQENALHIVFDHQIFSQQQYGGISRYFVEMGRAWVNDPEMNLEILAPLYINSLLHQSDVKNIKGVFLQKFPKAEKILPLVDDALSALYLSCHKPKILHETYYSEKALSPRGTKTVLTVYDMIHERLPQYFAPNDPLTRRKRIAVERADHIFCISESTKRDLVEFLGTDSKKISVVYLASSLQTIGEKKKTEKPYILFVGPRWGYKNFPTLLKAYGESQMLKKNFDLICVGGGAFSNAEKTAMSSFQIENCHQVSGGDNVLAQYYRDAAVFVYPSEYEGFGIPPLEAMSLDCPVITCNTSSLPEVCGDAALYFSPSDNAELKEQLESLLQSESKQQQFRNLGRKQVAKFSWKICAEATKLVYSSLQ